MLRGASNIRAMADGSHDLFLMRYSFRITFIKEMRRRLALPNGEDAFVQVHGFIFYFYFFNSLQAGMSMTDTNCYANQ